MILRIGLLIAAALAAFAAQPEKVKVLVITGQTDLPYHDWRASTPFLRDKLDATGRFEINVIEEPRGINREALAGYDVLLLNYNGPRFSRASEQAIEAFVRAGKGIVAFHGVSYGEFFGQVQKDKRWTAPGNGDPGWTAYAEMIGSTWKPENIGHSTRHVFTVTYTDKQHPIAAGESFTANDELYHKLDLKPNAHVVARAYSDPAKGGTGREEPIIWTTSFGSGRGVHLTLGHDLSSMAQPGFLAALARSLEWAATGAVAPPPAKAARKPRVLVVTGGHSFPAAFYSLFEGPPELDWTTAATQPEAFGNKLAGRFDVIVFHDMGETIGEKEKANLTEFVESGGGIVSIHHSIVDYTSWPWWYEQVIGGKYFVNAVEGHAKSEYKEGVNFTAVPVPAMAKHPVMAGVPPLPVHDEAYRGMWRAPGITVLMETDFPLNDKPVVYLGPAEKARVVFIQLGHSAETMRYPGYRRLVRNAIRWAAHDPE
jgi:uncharacterized protein